MEVDLPDLNLSPDSPAEEVEQHRYIAYDLFRQLIRERLGYGVLKGVDRFDFDVVGRGLKRAALVGPENIEMELEFTGALQ